MLIYTRTKELITEGFILMYVNMRLAQVDRIELKIQEFCTILSMKPNRTEDTDIFTVQYNSFYST